MEGVHDVRETHVDIWRSPTMGAPHILQVMNDHDLVLNPMVTWASPILRNPHIIWLLEPNNSDHLRKAAQCGPGEPCMHPTLNWEPPSLGASSAAQPHEMKNGGRFGERNSSPSQKTTRQFFFWCVPGVPLLFSGWRPKGSENPIPKHAD